MSEVVHNADDVLIHVTFLPDADVASIDGCPNGINPREWFDKIYMAAPNYYQSFSFGRGFFRIPAKVYEDIKT